MTIYIANHITICDRLDIIIYITNTHSNSNILPAQQTTGTLYY